VTPSTAPSATDYSRPIPTLAGSPGNLISLMGESPPTQPSSYEDYPRSLPYGWPSPRPSAAGSQPASASPPNPGRRPLSFQMDAHYLPPDLPSHVASPAFRRSSLHSHIAQSRAGGNPPLPHQPQAHFYGVPDLDLDLQSQTGMKAGERGYHFGFDNLPSAGGGGGGGPGHDVVAAAGYEGGLDVYSVSKRGLDTLASLKGLRGGVHHAKILPWTLSDHGSEFFPLVAVVVHGPVLPSPSPQSEIPGGYDGGTADRPGPSPTPPIDARDGMATRSALPVEFYQTTVDVYSLKTSKLVAVLLEAPKIQLKTSISSPIFQPPPPSGAFHIKADGGSIVVSSGITGETWVYRQLGTGPQEPPIQFACVGKLWTTLQHPIKADPAQETADRSRAAAVRQGPRSPIVALGGRWIAYCPATPSSQIALRATVPVPPWGKAPGLSSMTPPQLPSVNSDVDLPMNESVMNKIMRDATQEIISGAKWVGQQGWQAINNYWKGSSTPQPPRSPPPASQPWGAAGYPPRQEPSQFPPTHGAVAPVVAKEPGIISIIDIETLGSSATLHPVTTFSTPLGCSFLSFSPSGLSLFTASTKGDVQTVWDLMRTQHTKSSPLQSSASAGGSAGPRVRQIAQFSRMTVARIVDVAWTRPNGERILMVTERGTGHLLELPSSAFTWPPPRRRNPQQEAKTAAAPEGGASAVSYASNALTSAFDAARPLLTRPRRSSANIPQSTGATIVDHASHGGKIIAAGISHSLGKTGSAINQLRHTGENRVTLPSSSNPPEPSCGVWITGKRHHSLFVLGDGLVRMFLPRGRKTSSGADKLRPARLGRYKDFKLASLPADTIAAAVKRYLEPDEYLDLTDQNEAGNNTMILDSRPKPVMHDPSVESSIPQAEIESSAPYQPFHTDRRVSLFEHDTSQQTAVQHLAAASALLAETTLEDRPAQRRKSHRKADAAGTAKAGGGGAWVFGQPIQAVRLDTGYPPMSEEESFNISTGDSRALPPSAMERVLQHVGDRDEQIVVTTRRRRGGSRADQADDGFFEDDCEVLDFADQRV